MRSKIKRTIFLLAGFVLLAGVTILWLLHLWLGPSFPGYHAVNHDWALTRVARRAAPIRQALDRFQRDHSTYPEDQFALAPYLRPNSVSKEQPLIDGWSYLRHTDDPGYSLSQSLGWDPLLVYDFDGTKSQWTFEPGDGSPGQPVVLDP